MELRTHYLNCFGYMYSCTLCEVTLKTRTYFRSHMRKKHGVPKSSLPVSTMDRRLSNRNRFTKLIASKRANRRMAMLKSLNKVLNKGLNMMEHLEDYRGEDEDECISQSHLTTLADHLTQVVSAEPVAGPSGLCRLPRPRTAETETSESD